TDASFSATYSPLSMDHQAPSHRHSPHPPHQTPPPSLPQCLSATRLFPPPQAAPLAPLAHHSYSPQSQSTTHPHPTHSAPQDTNKPPPARATRPSSAAPDSPHSQSPAMQRSTAHCRSARHN